MKMNQKGSWWIHFISKDGGCISMEDSDFFDIKTAMEVFTTIVDEDGLPPGTASISIELIDR